MRLPCIGENQHLTSMLRECIRKLCRPNDPTTTHWTFLAQPETSMNLIPNSRAGPLRARADLFAIVSTLCLWSPMSLRAADLMWTNNLGGAWNMAANWSPNQV